MVYSYLYHYTLGSSVENLYWFGNTSCHGYGNPLSSLLDINFGRFDPNRGFDAADSAFLTGRMRTSNACINGC